MPPPWLMLTFAMLQATAPTVALHMKCTMPSVAQTTLSTSMPQLDIAGTYQCPLWLHQTIQRSSGFRLLWQRVLHTCMSGLSAALCALACLLPFCPVCQQHCTRPCVSHQHHTHPPMIHFPHSGPHTNCSTFLLVTTRCGSSIQDSELVRVLRIPLCLSIHCTCVLCTLYAPPPS